MWDATLRAKWLGMRNDRTCKICGHTQAHEPATRLANSECQWLSTLESPHCWKAAAHCAPLAAIITAAHCKGRDQPCHQAPPGGGPGPYGLAGPKPPKLMPMGPVPRLPCGAAPTPSCVVAPKRPAGGVSPVAAACAGPVGQSGAPAPMPYWSAWPMAGGGGGGGGWLLRAAAPAPPRPGVDMPPDAAEPGGPEPTVPLVTGQPERLPPPPGPGPAPASPPVPGNGGGSGKPPFKPGPRGGAGVAAPPLSIAAAAAATRSCSGPSETGLPLERVTEVARLRSLGGGSLAGACCGAGAGAGDAYPPPPPLPCIGGHG